MKQSVLEKKQIPQCAVELAGRLVKRVAWPERRQAMAEVTLALLDGKARTAEAVFGWGALGGRTRAPGVAHRHRLHP